MRLNIHTFTSCQSLDRLAFWFNGMETVNRRKRSYTAAFKLKVVEHAEKKSKNDASKVFLVDRKRVQDWCKQKEDLMTTGRSTNDY